MVKRLIVCCDGTWQASDKPDAKKNVESNVTKMCRALANTGTLPSGDTVQQIVYYQSGVGTDVLGHLSAVLSGAHGFGLNENVVEAYNFICLNYQVIDEIHDEIFLFGFSRGAYTVRALAGLISSIGILTKASLKDFPAIYKAYQDPSFKKAADVKKEFQYTERVKPDTVKIKVIGVWDTVGSLGVPDAWFSLSKIQQLWNKKYQFHDPNLNDSIENAFHALALDEHRMPFSPTLWHLPQNGKTNLVQCWFPGVHINIGGGGSDEIDKKEQKFTDLGEISYITFAWMVDLCSPFLDFKDTYIKPLAGAHLEKIQTLQREMAGKPIHNGGWAQGMINDSFDGSMAVTGTRTRAPGQYGPTNQILPKPKEKSGSSASSGPLTALPLDTNEYIHPSARIRITKRYRKIGDRVWDRPIDQVSLGGFQMRYLPETANATRSGLVWEKKWDEGTVVQIPEYQIPGLENAVKDPVKLNYYAERAVLRPDDVAAQSACAPEYQMVVHPEDLLGKDHKGESLPPAPVHSFASTFWTSAWKAILGYTPSSWHWWEKE